MAVPVGGRQARPIGSGRAVQRAASNRAPFVSPSPLLVSPSFQQRIAIAAVALAGLASPAAVLAAANPGGTAPGATTTGPTPGATAPTPPSTPHTSLPHITDARCVPTNACSSNPRQVSLRGRLAFRGPGLASGMQVAFPARAGAHISRV